MLPSFTAFTVPDERDRRRGTVPPSREAVPGLQQLRRGQPTSPPRAPARKARRMAALTATHQGPWAEVLALLPPPQLPATGPTQLKLRVLAAGLAFPDVLSIEGSHMSQQVYPFIPGNEVSGEVIEVGSEVTSFTVGDRVFGRGVIQPQCLVEESATHQIPGARFSRILELDAFPFIYLHFRTQLRRILDDQTAFTLISARDSN